MIRILRLKGQSYRQISSLLGISAGSVSCEIKQMKKEIEEGKYIPPSPNQKVSLVKPEVAKVTKDEETRIELDLT